VPALSIGQAKAGSAAGVSRLISFAARGSGPPGRAGKRRSSLRGSCAAEASAALVATSAEPRAGGAPFRLMDGQDDRRGGGWAATAPPSRMASRAGPGPAAARGNSHEPMTTRYPVLMDQGNRHDDGKPGLRWSATWNRHMPIAEGHEHRVEVRADATAAASSPVRGRAASWNMEADSALSATPANPVDQGPAQQPVGHAR